MFGPTVGSAPEGCVSVCDFVGYLLEPEYQFQSAENKTIVKLTTFIDKGVQRHQIQLDRA